MIQYGTLLGAIVPIFLVIGAGSLARGFKLFPEQAEQPFNRLNLNLLYPCLIFSYTLGNKALLTLDGLLGAPALGFGITAGAMLVALPFARLLHLPPAGRRTFAFVTGITNYGYLPIPISAVLFHDTATTGVLLVFNIGVEIAIWTVGVLLLVGEWRFSQLRKLINAPVVCLAIAIVLNLSGVSEHLPKFLLDAINYLGATSIPFALILIGAVLYDLAHQIPWFKQLHVPLTGLLLRLGLFPVALLLVTAAVPPSYLELRRVLILQASMPCGIFPIVITKYYSGDIPVAFRVVLATTIAGIFLIPLWLATDLHLFGLDVISTSLNNR